MPIYEYICTNCGHAFEEMQTMKEESLIICPNCGQHTLKRLLGAGSGIIFKGSGFYITDYKKKNSTESKHRESKSGKKESKETKETKESKENSKDTGKESKETKSKESKNDTKSDKQDKK